MSFDVKDSGRREEFTSGMRRDTEEGKIDYTYLAEMQPLVDRLMLHLQKGAKKYGRGNWQLADSMEEMERFRRSASRHFMQWVSGDRDEDHAAAVVFNLNAYERLREQFNDDLTGNLGPGTLLAQALGRMGELVHGQGEDPRPLNIQEG